MAVRIDLVCTIYILLSVYSFHLISSHFMLTSSHCFVLLYIHIYLRNLPVTEKTFRSVLQDRFEEIHSFRYIDCIHLYDSIRKNTKGELYLLISLSLVMVL